MPNGWRHCEVSLLDGTQSEVRGAGAGRSRADEALLIFWRMSNRLITSAIFTITRKTGDRRGVVTKMALSQGDAASRSH